MADGQSSGTTSQQSMRRGVVKQVLSGDAIIMQGQTTQGPPPEATVYLSNVTAPRLGKRPTETTPATADEPFAWEAREWLRKKLVGQVVTFIKDFTASSGRDHGRVYLGGTNPENAENVTKSAVSEGFLEVRPGKIADEYAQELMNLQEEAKSAKRGRWADDVIGVREVKWVVDNPRSLVEKYHQKPVDAVIEMVRDGSTYRLLLLPSFEYITLQLSGVKSPSTRGSDSKPEAFAEEAKFFVEVRLLQRDVQVVLESTSNQNVVGSILHPKGNIAESLLREGYARCVDWSIGLATGGAEKLRQAEKVAKEKRLRLWRGYAPSTSNGLSEEKKAFTGKVVEIVMNDAMIVQKDDGKEIKIHLSSVRLPREQGEGEGASRPAPNRQFRPLYDVPFMFQAREFLRKKLVGKTVHVTVDYVQPKSEQYPEKTCCTVKQGDTNIAEALIQRGLSKVVRHRADDDSRSSSYDALLAAEANAEKAAKGLWQAKSADRKDTQRIQELAGDAARSKQFLPYLQRGGRNEGIVEFIASGSRLRIYVPKETCLITFLLGGINCPKGARPGGPTTEGEPFANEAAQFTRNLVMQHEVDFEVEGIDKMGNFIGYLFVRSADGGRPQNLSELLVEQGLASVHHFSAEKSGHYNSLVSAEIRAKNAKRNIWANFKEEAEDEERKHQSEDKSERVVEYKKVTVTDVQRGSLKFSAQLIEDGPRLEKLSAEMRDYLQSNPPMTGAYHPKRGELCASKFSVDDQWYRVKVESIKAGTAEVLFVDYGNRDSVQANSLAALPREFATSPPFAKEYTVGLVSLPNDKDYATQADHALEQLMFSVSTADLNVEYRANGSEFAQVLIELDGKRTDVGRFLVEEGYVLAEKRREHRLQQLVADYQDAEKKARRERAGVWEYGDCTGDQAL